MPNRTGKQVERRPFGAVVRDLLIERGVTTPMGNPNWSGFVQDLEGVQYETLRKAVTGERRPSVKLMEQVAQALGVEAGDFYEYQLWQAQRAFDPAEVGDDTAFANLVEWIASHQNNKR